MNRFTLAVTVLCLLSGLLIIEAGCTPGLVVSTSTPTVDTFIVMGATDKLAELVYSGGIEGIAYHLVVYTDGSASYFDYSTDTQIDFQVESTVFDRLMAMAVVNNRP